MSDVKENIRNVIISEPPNFLSSPTLYCVRVEYMEDHFGEYFPFTDIIGIYSSLEKACNAIVATLETDMSCLLQGAYDDGRIYWEMDDGKGFKYKTSRGAIANTVTIARVPLDETV